MTRIKWVDIAKGLCILWVVIGHTGLPEAISVWIFSFHMPFFFFISGFLYKEEKYAPTQFLVRRIRSLLLPYILFSVLVILFMPIIKTYNVTAANLPLVIYDVLCHGWASNRFTYPLWFIPVLFITEIIYMLLCRLPNILRVLSVILLGGLSYLLYLKNIDMVYSLSVVGTAIVFYYLGNLLQNMKLNVSNRRNMIISIGLFLICIIINVYISQINLPRIDLAYNCLSNPFLMYIAAISGIVVMILLSMFLSRNSILANVLSYLGQNTYIILATHLLYMQLIITFIGNGYMLLRHLLMWGFIILTIYSINNYAPWILGKKKAYEK